MKKSFKLEELCCAHCAAKMEEATRKTKGVKDAIVNFMMLKMDVEFEDGVNIDEIKYTTLDITGKN